MLLCLHVSHSDWTNLPKFNCCCITCRTAKAEQPSRKTIHIGCRSCRKRSTGLSTIRDWNGLLVKKRAYSFFSGNIIFLLQPFCSKTCSCFAQFAQHSSPTYRGNACRKAQGYLCTVGNTNKQGVNGSDRQWQ
jgi:hypothetical protein